jgi:hypothetical protein
MVGADERRGWVRKADRGSDLKGAGYGRFNRNPPYAVFPEAFDLKPAPRDRAAHLAAAVLLPASGRAPTPLDGYARPHNVVIPPRI